MPRRDSPVADSETENDENDGNVPNVAFFVRLESRSSRDTPLRDITDQFFHPPSPSPVKRKRSFEPPRRPKKPKSMAYPADPPNWLYSRSDSSLPPSSPLPPSTTNIDHPAQTAARFEYHLGTPFKASDSDPFGFVAAEHALKAKRPHKPTSRVSVVKSPPRSTVLPSTFASFPQPEAPVPTNNEDIDGLYADEPVAGPSHSHVLAAPLLMMHSDQSYVELVATGSQPTIPDPLRTPRKRKRRISLTPNGEPDSDDEGTSIPSSPSPVKVSVGVSGNRRPGIAPSSDTFAHAQSRAVGTNKPPAIQSSRMTRVKTSYQDIPTPASTRRSSRQSTIPPTPVPPRRSKRQAVVGAQPSLERTSNAEDGNEGSRMKLRSRNTRATKETTKTTKSTPRKKRSPTKFNAQIRKKTTTATKPPRGRPKGKASAKNSKGKGKGKLRPLDDVLDLSDDTREKYEKERRDRLEYFKRLEGYQIQKENVYVV